MNYKVFIIVYNQPKKSEIMKRFLLFTGMIALIAIVLTSCKKDPPVCDFTYVANGLTVTFTSAATNSETYLWEFGDGNTSTEMNPVHKYDGGGDYEVKLTATGEGGSDYKRETITVVVSLADVKDMLSGGSSAVNGKTWILKTSAITTGDGASAVEPSMLVLIPTPADFYGWLGREKNTGLIDEFTFKSDGSYSVNAKNDTVIAISIFALVNGITVPNTNGPYGTCRAKYTGPAGATWTLNESNFTVDAITNPSETAVPPPHANVTFTGTKWLSLSTGSYFGFLDFTTSSKIIIKSITPTQMQVALMVCMYSGVGLPGGLAYANYPTHMYHMTFIPKP
jgi:PKD repeat protein